ncbi:MAG TPA: hypothetical protein VGQ57_20530, partial [Polyangiaceae bacterium]|nr:hypothetical protein [Polyangiaceae bacterium]
MTRRLPPIAVALPLLAACGGAPPPLPYSPVHHAPKVAAHAALPKVPSLRATQIGRVPDGTFGPYLGQGKAGGVLVWAAAEGDARGWYAAAVAPDGTLRGAARRLADAPPDIGLVVVRGSPESAGYTVVSTRRTALSEWVEATLLDDKGELVAGPRALAEIHGRALWVEAVPLGT